MLKCITYVSTSRIENTDVLATLFEKAKNYNIDHHISGILIHKNGVFMQIIEGDEEYVDRIYNKVLIDKRHHQLIKLIDVSIPNRLFEDYKTSFSLVNSTSEFKELNNYIDWLKQADSSCALKAVSILENFIKK